MSQTAPPMFRVSFDAIGAIFHVPGGDIDARRVLRLFVFAVFTRVSSDVRGARRRGIKARCEQWRNAAMFCRAVSRNARRVKGRQHTPMLRRARIAGARAGCRPDVAVPCPCRHAQSVRLRSSVELPTPLRLPRRVTVPTPDIHDAQ